MSSLECSLPIRIRTGHPHDNPGCCSYCKRAFLSNESVVYHPELTPSPAYHHGCYVLKQAGIAELAATQTPASTASRRAAVEQAYPMWCQEEVDFVLQMHSAPPKKMRKEEMSNRTLAAFAAIKDKRVEFDVLQVLIRELDSVWPSLLASELMPDKDCPSIAGYTLVQKESILAKATQLRHCLQNLILDLAPYFVKDRRGVATINGMIWDIRHVVAVYVKLVERLEKCSDLTSRSSYEKRMEEIENALYNARRLPINMMNIAVSYDQSVRYWSVEDRICSGYPIEEWFDMYRLVTARLGAKDSFIISVFATILVKYGNQGSLLSIDRSNWRGDDNDEDGASPRKKSAQSSPKKRSKSDGAAEDADGDVDDDQGEADTKKKKKTKKDSPVKGASGSKKGDKGPPPPPPPPPAGGSAPDNSTGGGANSGEGSTNPNSWKWGQASNALTSAFDIASGGRMRADMLTEEMREDMERCIAAMKAISGKGNYPKVELDPAYLEPPNRDPVASPYTDLDSIPSLVASVPSTSSLSVEEKAALAMAEPILPSSQSSTATSRSQLTTALQSSPQAMTICTTPPSSLADINETHGDLQSTGSSSSSCGSPTPCPPKKRIKESHEDYSSLLDEREDDNTNLHTISI